MTVYSSLTNIPLTIDYFICLPHTIFPPEVRAHSPSLFLSNDILTIIQAASHRGVSINDTTLIDLLSNTHVHSALIISNEVSFPQIYLNYKILPEAPFNPGFMYSNITSSRHALSAILGNLPHLRNLPRALADLTPIIDSAPSNGEPLINVRPSTTIPTIDNIPINRTPFRERDILPHTSRLKWDHLTGVDTQGANTLAINTDNVIPPDIHQTCPKEVFTRRYREVTATISMSTPDVSFHDIFQDYSSEVPHGSISDGSHTRVDVDIDMLSTEMAKLKAK